MRLKDIQYAPKLINDLLNVIHNAIIITDSEQRIIFSNSWANRMFRTNEHQFSGLDIRTIFMQEDREIFAANIIAITKKENEFEGEAMLQRLDGTGFHCFIASSFFLWDDGKEGMAFTIHDLTEVKTIKKSLRRSEQAAFLGALTYDISHQIRNPVMVIGGLAKRLDPEKSSSPKTKAIIKETNRLETLLATLENFIKLPPPQPEKINFLELKRATDNLLRAELTDSRCQWHCTHDKNIASKSLFVDTKHLLDAIQKVVVNSCESYHKNIGIKKIMIHFSLSTDQKFPYVITVTDQGEGIPEKNVPLVFDHFYSNKTNHIGMGLTFAQRIIDLQNGKISLHSKQGKGTTVAIYLLDERRRMIRTCKLT